MRFSRQVLIELIIFSVFLIIFLRHSLLFIDSSRLYSTSIAHRLQTEALLHGHLSLSPQPFGYLNDFVWTGHGLQQNWGLGVPLLKLPFEWVSAQLGFGAFPDRLVLLFYLTVTVVLLNTALRTLLKTLGEGYSSEVRCLIRWYLIAWIFFSPAMAGLIQERINVYYETVLYACLYTYVMLSVFWIYMTSRKTRVFFVLCLLSGLACLIRQTLIFYGATTVAVASIFVYQEKRSLRIVMVGLCCFSTGILIELWSNYLRFGSILEFGCPFSGSPTINYLGGFGSLFAFAKEDFFGALKELLGDLFFNRSWQLHATRWRWGGGYYSPPFNLTHVVTLVLGFILFIWGLLSRFFNRIIYPKWTGLNSKCIYFSLSLGCISFGMIFKFYLHFTYISCRYLSDFSGAVNTVFIVLVLLIFHWLHFYRQRSQSILFLLFLFFVLLFYCTNYKFFQFDSQSHKKEIQSFLTDSKGIKKCVAAFNHSILKSTYLPDMSYCGQTYSTAGLKFQYTGWDIHKDCAVSAVTSAILPFKRCITLNYTIQNIKQIPKVQVRRDSVFFKLVDSQMSLEDTKLSQRVQMTEVFCSDSPVTNTVALYMIGWVTFDGFNQVHDRKLPIKLNWVKV